MKVFFNGNDFKISDFRDCLLIIVVSFFIFFINNNVIPADIMEARNLGTAQEMVLTGQYFVPTLNGELRLTKPPLPTWIAAIVELVIPDNIVVQRAMTGIAATLMALFLYLLIRKLTNQRLPAMLSAIVMITTYSVVMMGRTATWDIYCHSFMLMAIFFLVGGLQHEGAQIGRFALVGILMGLSFLSKGPISFYALLLPFLIAYIAYAKPKIKGKVISLCAMLLLFIIIAFWWPVYIAILHSDIGTAVVGKESSNWLNYNVRPFWYYWGFSAESGIWILFWLSSFVFFAFNKKIENRNIFKFSIVWTLATLLLLSLVPEKKTRYLLPMLIPGAVNIGFYFWYSIQNIGSKGFAILFRINSMIIGLIALAMPVFLYLVFVRKDAMGWINFVFALPLFIIASILIIAGAYRRKGIKPIWIFSGTALVMVVFMVFCVPAAGKLFLNPQRHSIHLIRENDVVHKLPFFHNPKETIRMELVYEANCIIRKLNLENDSLFYGSLPFVLITTEPAKELLAGKNVTIEYIDTYDNNWRIKGSKRYNKNLVKEVSIIRKNE